MKSAKTRIQALERWSGHPDDVTLWPTAQIEAYLARIYGRVPEGEELEALALELQRGTGQVISPSPLHVNEVTAA